MAVARVRWTVTSPGKAKRAVAVGPFTKKDRTSTSPFKHLSQAGVPLASGTYRLDWVFVGSTGNVVSVDVDLEEAGEWVPKAHDGPRTVSNASSRVGSGDGQEPVFFRVP